jgi:hypothetical protein
MKKLWWILCNVGAAIIIHNMWVQMNGFDKWLAVLLTSSMWIGNQVDEIEKVFGEAA